MMSFLIVPFLLYCVGLLLGIAIWVHPCLGTKHLYVYVSYHVKHNTVGLHVKLKKEVILVLFFCLTYGVGSLVTTYLVEGDS